MRIVTVVVTHKRLAIAIETVRILKGQTEEVVVVGDSYEDRMVAQVTDSFFLKHGNQPLGAKLQAGVNKARDFSPDVLLLCGSDSWLSREWCRRGVELLDDGADCVGSSIWYSCQALPMIRAVVTEWRYLWGTIVGSGRVISKNFLDRVDWQIYPVDKRRGLDGFSDAILRKSGAKVSCMNSLVKMMEVKGPWPMMHPLSYISDNTTSNQRGDEIIGDSLRLWLEENFPGSIWALQKAVDHFRL